MFVRNRFPSIVKVSLVLLAACLCTAPVCSQELNVLDTWLIHQDAPNSLYNYLASQAFEVLDQKYRELDSLESEEDWLEQKQKSREALQKVIGPFPKKTPLNPEVTGI